MCLSGAVSLLVTYIYYTPNNWGRQIEIFGVGLTAYIFFAWALMAGLPYFFEVKRLEELRGIALSYPAYISIGANRAHINVSSWLTNPKEVELKPNLFGRLCIRYLELEKLSTDELRQKLDASGVWNPNNGWYEKGRTLDEGLMMVIYTRRADKETVAIEATQATHKKLSHEAALAPDLQVRKQVEQQREAIARELGELEGLPDDSFNWSLKKIGGEVRIYTRGGDAVAAVFTLARGVYRLDVKDEDNDGRTPQRLRIEGTPYELKISPPVKRGEIEITGENGITDTIPLY